MGDFARSRGYAELPENDLIDAIIQDRAQSIPTLTDDLKAGEIGLSHLVDGRGPIRVPVSNLDHHIFRRSEQVSFSRK